MTSQKKGHPFIEILSNALQEDYRFPILEIFVFLYAISTFALGALTFSFTATSNSALSAINLVSNSLGIALFIFVILILKNVAFGIGGDLEKGTLQTFLSYPLRRRGIITAKLLSAIGLSLAVFVMLQVLGIAILAPSLLSSQLGVFALAYISSFAYPLLLAAIVLVMTILIRRGAIALVIGIVLYFAIQIAQAILVVLAIVLKSNLPLEILSVVNPITALTSHYGSFGGGGIFGAHPWTPSLETVYLFIGASYLITFVVYAVAFYLFDRRLGL